jgi:hypothetical protein
MTLLSDPGIRTAVLLFGAVMVFESLNSIRSHELDWAIFIAGMIFIASATLINHDNRSPTNQYLKRNPLNWWYKI